MIERGLGASTAYIDIISESEIFSEKALAKGVFDGAQVEILVINYEDVSQGHIAVFSGMMDEITLQNGIFKATLQGGIDTLKNKVGNLFSPQCRAQFCDKACALKAARYTFKGTISKVTDEFKIFTDDNLTADSGYYTRGTIKFLTGKNSNFSAVVQHHTPQCICLATGTPYSMSVNDKYSVLAGCDKNFRTCVQKFGNAKNFRGEPHAPETRFIYGKLE